MRVLSDKDYRLLERLVSLSQEGMHRAMTQYLKTKYTDIIITKDYIVALGDIPIALVAHMDTVFTTPVSNLYYDQKKGVLWSSEGLGADDRAGIFAILKIVQSGLKPSIILTTDEESGGIGANVLAQKVCPIPNLKYMIQLDRHGSNDCVFYSCYNQAFIEYIEKFGFCEQWGSFSDISFLMPAWKICGTNLSVGYENEHSYSETLNINQLFDTIHKVKIMLQEENIPQFEYKEMSHADMVALFNKTDNLFGQHCSKCKQLFLEYELIPVQSKNNTFKFYCSDCIVDNVEWCDYCGEPYEIQSSTAANTCGGCLAKICTKTSKNNSN